MVVGSFELERRGIGCDDAEARVLEIRSTDPPAQLKKLGEVHELMSADLGAASDLLSIAARRR